jgi:hypothetical protein
MMEGGMRIPRQPDAATVPNAKDLLYFCFSIIGKDITPNNTTDAPIIPVEAARIIPIKATVMAKPPLTLPNNFYQCLQCITMMCY